MDKHFARWSMCTTFATSIEKNGGGESNASNTWYIKKIIFYCMGVEGWKISDFVKLDQTTPQFTTAEVPLTENVETTPVTAIIPLQIIQVSRANKCKLETCFDEVIENKKNREYCSDKCRIKNNNNNRQKKN